MGTNPVGRRLRRPTPFTSMDPIRMSTRLTKLSLALIAALAAAPSAHAASNFAQGSSGTLSAPVNLQFSITIPRFIFLRVGSAASVNTLVFSPTVAQMVASTPVTATGGDIGGTDVTYQMIGNAGSLTLAASNPVNLTSGGNNIPMTTLSATVPTGTQAPPAFGGTVSLTGPIVNLNGTWRYAWTNPAATVYPSGTYAATVTYTLSSP
jgi:hypothetical protein